MESCGATKANALARLLCHEDDEEQLLGALPWSVDTPLRAWRHVYAVWTTRHPMREILAPRGYASRHSPDAQAIL